MAQEPSPARAPRLLDQVRDRIRIKHYSIRTEQAYVDGIRRDLGTLHNGRDLGMTPPGPWPGAQGWGMMGWSIQSEELP